MVVGTFIRCLRAIGQKNHDFTFGWNLLQITLVRLCISFNRIANGFSLVKFRGCKYLKMKLRGVFQNHASTRGVSQNYPKQN